MFKPLVLLPAAALLIGSTEPDVLPPRYDVYSVNDDETIATRVGQPFVVRTWIHSGKELWRLVPQDGVVALESAQFEQFPEPGSGVGFTEGYDITVKIVRPGTYRLRFQHTDKETGRIEPMNSYQELSVTAR